MKIYFTTGLALILMSTTACKKSTDGNKSVIKEETVDTTVENNNGVIDSSTTTKSVEEIDGKTVTEESFGYKASDGSRAKLTILDSEKEKTATIWANNHKFVLDKKADNHYERNGIHAEIKGDSLFITQDNNVIPLVRVK